MHSRSELDFIKHLRAHEQKRETLAAGLVRSIGDDAAVVGQLAGRDTVVTTDLLVEDVDFRRDSTPPAMLGHKALAISLSDIAATGARARWALLSIGVPQDIWDSSFVEQLYEGFFALADRYDVRLVGGDLSRTPEKIVIDSIVLGECAHERAVLRSGARCGDQLFVTGSLGGSAAGLRLIERGARVECEDAADADSHAIQSLILRHLRPEPRVGWGLVLGEEPLATAMIDISDGLCRRDQGSIAARTRCRRRAGVGIGTWWLGSFRKRMSHRGTETQSTLDEDVTVPLFSVPLCLCGNTASATPV